MLKKTDPLRENSVSTYTFAYTCLLGHKCNN